MLHPQQVVRPYGLAIAAVLIALLLMLALDPFLHLTQASFLLFFGAATLSALYGGRDAGILATLLSAILANYFFLPPLYSLALDLPSALRMGLFTAEGILISVLVGSLRVAQAQVRNSLLQLNASEAEITGLNQALQRRVDELQTLFEVIPVNIAIAEDADCQVIRVNPTLARLLQIDLTANASVTPVLEQPHPPYRFYQNGQELSGHDLPQQRAAKHGVAVRNVEIELIRQDQTSFQLFGHAVPLFDESGNPRGSVAVYTDITDRKRSEDQLQQREVEFRTLVENIPDLIARCDRDLRYLYVSPNVEQVMAMPATAIVGKTPEELGCTGPQSKVWYDAVRAVFDSGECHSGEAVYPRADGESRLYQVHCVPERRLGTQVETVVIFSRDITDFKQVEASLRHSEERLRLAMAAGQIGTWDLDITTGELFWSEQHFKIFGYEPTATGQASYEWWRQGVYPDDWESVRAHWLQSQKERQLYQAEYRIVRADTGEVGWIAALGSFTHDAKGRAVRSLGVVFDITERKQAEASILHLNQQLQDKVTELQTLLEVIPIGIGIAKDPACQDIRVNPAFARMLNVSTANNASLSAPDPERPTTFKVYQDGRELAAAELPLQKAAKTGEEIHDLELEVVWQDGTTLSLLEYAAPLLDHSGCPRGSVGAFLDISDRKQAEAEREQLLQREQIARAEAERVNRVKDEFLAILSHELRSPLNPILGWARLLQTKQFDRQLTQKALATIERNAKLQTQLIDDLLDVARILRGKLKLHETHVELAAVIEAAVEVVKTAAEAKDITLHLDLTPNCQVKGDEGRLQQIVWNLLANAIKFTPEGGQVNVSLAVVNQRAEISVTDTGQGISSEFLPHLFQSFRQEDVSITRQFGGLGLGLSIVKYLVDAHGGTIIANSPGKGLGATFVVQLALLKEPVMLSAAKPPLPADVNLAGIQILAVDDDEDAREVLAAILTEYGAEVCVVASGSAALARLQTWQPTLLICDISMPDRDGYTLLQQIRALPAAAGGNIPAMAVTALAREEDRQQALQHGFQKHIAKPILPEQLAIAIAELLQTAAIA